MIKEQPKQVINMSPEELQAELTKLHRAALDRMAQKQYDTLPVSSASTGGLKYDSSKLPLHLLSTDAINGLAAVLQFGANKYAPNNWRNGIVYTRLLGALLRHTFEILKGNDLDDESGLPHIDHVGCCWMFLSELMKTRKDLDDRWLPQQNNVDRFQTQEELHEAQLNIQTVSNDFPSIRK